MVGVKKTISTAIVALAVASVVHADMMPVSLSQGGDGPPTAVGSPAVSRPGSDSCQAKELRGTFDDFGGPAMRFLPEMKPQAGDAGLTKPAEVLTDSQSSFSLCLYTLLGLGLCRTAPWIKRLNLGLIPDWYHTGGPYQIGHSLAIAPDCLSHAPLVCFIQPQGVTDEVAPPYFRGTIAPLLRESQFIRIVLASRGPPRLTHESSLA